MNQATPEQVKLRGELIARYGELTFMRALEMSGLRCCLRALASDELKPHEREVAFHLAGRHLARLQASWMQGEASDALTECALRIDAAMDAWTLDDIEARDGLPPMPG